MDYTEYSQLAISRQGAVLTISLNRPDTRNAIDEDLHRELARIFRDVDGDDDTDVVILTGAGGCFCAGGNLDWVLSMHGDPIRTSTAIRRDRRIQNDLLDLEKPIIAKVRGPAIGLGCSLALFCDFVYATPQARFADPHVSVGLVAGDGGAVIWPQLIGYARARRYLLTGDPISGAEAADIGLITVAVPEDQLDAEVDALADRLTSGATYSIKWTKASINAGLKVTANAIIDRAAAFENLTQMMNDNRIALEAFKAKAAPKFTGT
ncbi:MAG TPA: enoyl-CoA hydratase-related protein [Acidimicrobiales bacterium]|nr:enoyl-CoA hydratase-related protein [Acidimicrobiales bacterium]